jgi:hypothetical protein
MTGLLPVRYERVVETANTKPSIALALHDPTLPVSYLYSLHYITSAVEYYDQPFAMNVGVTWVSLQLLILGVLCFNMVSETDYQH